MTDKNSRLTIGLVCDDSLDKTDGVQQYTLSLGKYLSSRGHKVHYITSTTKRTDLPNTHVLSRNMRVSFNGNALGMPLPASPRSVHQLLSSVPFDILHVQTPYSPLLAGQLILQAPKRVALVSTFHIYPDSRLVSVATKLLGLAVLPLRHRFDARVSVSTAAQVFAAGSFYGTSTVIPNMVDVRTFQIQIPTNTATLKIVFLGRLVARKGALELLQAIHYAVEHELFSTLFHVSVGGKGDLLPRLQQYVTSHGLTDYVTFAGFIAEDQKPTFLADSDIAVFPSLGGESFGISLIEAMAASRGVVLGGNNPGYATVMEGLEDQLVEPRDTKAFATRLAAYVNDAKLRNTSHTKQQMHVMQYDVRHVGQKILASYYHALRSR